MNLNDWIRKNTIHHSLFWDLKHLVEEKQKQNLKISLCLPTLNEESTIGKEIVMFKSELMDRYPLLDEIAVISSDILPQYGEKKGKGENLWKAVYELTGDIIIYVDADIKNIHPRFAYGLVAPLIYRPELQYIKAFYDRPLAFSQGVRPSGGGRVTEILVRPLFSLFFPDLTGLIQPLSGEYAVRRDVLDKIPFPIGYGVETSHLIDVYEKWGMEAIAQVDLDQRVHRNQETRDLGKMAFGILRAFLFRAEALGVIGDLPELNTLLRQFQAKDEAFEQVSYEIVEEERPPMIDIPEYRKKFGIGT
jgi:glucosyl-3-phosphoglycerate synthase